MSGDVQNVLLSSNTKNTKLLLDWFETCFTTVLCHEVYVTASHFLFFCVAALVANLLGFDSVDVKH